jgi:hypothetical protein
MVPDARSTIRSSVVTSNKNKAHPSKPKHIDVTCFAYFSLSALGASEDVGKIKAFEDFASVIENL